MPRAHWVGDAVYDAAELFVAECLRADGSLFTPGRQVWSDEVVDDFYTRFFVNEDTGTGSFMEKLEQQLERAADETIQLAAEALYFNYLCEDDTGAPHKTSIVARVLGWMSEPATVPPELAAAYAGGLARIGLAKTQKWQQVSFLIRFVRAWKSLEGDRRDELLRDPWQFREFVHEVPKHAASVQVEGLLHLVFPEEFEPVVSPKVKQLIAKELDVYLSGDEANVDQQLAAIREALAEEHGAQFSFYDPGVTALWQGQDGRSRTAGGWIVRGERAYGTNLVPQWLKEGFVSMGATPEGEVKVGMTTREIMDLVASHYPDATRQQLIGGANAGRQFASEIAIGDWVMTRDGDNVYAGRFTSAQTWHPSAESGTARRRAVDWVNADEPLSWGDLPESLRRRATNPNTVWNLKDQAAVLAGLFGPGPVSVDDEDGETPTPDGQVRIPSPGSLADRLLVTRSWLDEIVALLNEKRQVVFYGPPGTGKTFIAQVLAEHVDASGGEFDLVQFHPAYSYEDFFEGYRPRLGAAGAVEFELRPGPLRRLADQARANPDKPYLLIIDEINRGNIAKIFGELYFLLEYRDRAIRLQYSSDDEFSLPDNLFVIGTMNTADRSIALVDSALRRRFYFVGFLPTEEPLRSVLRKWLDGNGYDAEAADYLGALNDALAHSVGSDEEFAIGPSYFITRDGPPELNRIWRHAIAPLLQERFFGARRLPEIEQEFSPSALARAGSEDE